MKKVINMETGRCYGSIDTRNDETYYYTLRVAGLQEVECDNHAVYVEEI